MDCASFGGAAATPTLASELAWAAGTLQVDLSPGGQAWPFWGWASTPGSPLPSEQKNGITVNPKLKRRARAGRGLHGHQGAGEPPVLQGKGSEG